MPPGSSLLFAPVVEGVEYGGKLPSFGGIWINFSEPLDNFCVFRTNLLFEAVNFGVKRINRLCIVLLLGAPYLVLELPDIAVGPQLDFVPVDCLNDLLHIGDSRLWYCGSRIVTLRSRNHGES